jgi:hypothetical protein
VIPLVFPIGPAAIELRDAPGSHGPRLDTNLTEGTVVTLLPLRDEGIPQG